MAKYLIFGKGYLGSRINDHFKDSFLSNSIIKSEEDVLKEIKSYNPEVVINAAGKTGKPNVDWCETHKEETYFSNVLLPKIIAQACKKMNVRMIHIGSGCIYEGDNNGKGFSEDDRPNFFGSFYSITKMVAEEILKDYNVLQVRIRMPLDSIPGERNLIDKLLKYSKIISIPNSITVIDDFLDILQQLIEKKVSGIINVVNKEPITHEKLLSIYEEISGEKLNYQIISAEQLDKITAARRSNCVLSVKKLEILGIKVKDVDVSVRECLKKYVSNKNRNNTK